MTNFSLGSKSCNYQSVFISYHTSSHKAFKLDFIQKSFNFHYYILHSHASSLGYVSAMYLWFLMILFKTIASAQLSN